MRWATLVAREGPAAHHPWTRGSRRVAVSSRATKRIRSDATLVAAAREGDREALEALLARYASPVYRFGLRLCGSEEEARDVLQETLMTAFRGLHAFREQARLSTWLFQVARSHCSRERRREARGGERLPFDAEAVRAVPSLERAPDEVAHARKMGAMLRDALAALSASDREALLLRDVEGLSAEEAARLTGIDVRAHKSRLHRARMRLRERLARGDGDS
ncbi:sigma-70 family RNA polymerase sigma factor [Myxococcus sp. CA040A]|nr:sigma-70 family RNA polymerase sigma factor [Myxococcus sp. CA040A]NTX00475.1 sigma-70 family RNA polymerase sigma factor [Myxococcus sp. CA040A]